MSRFIRRRLNTLSSILLLILIVVLCLRSLRKQVEVKSRNKIQYAFKSSPLTPLNRYRMKAVKEETVHAWSGYKAYAWMEDELQPVSAGSSRKFCIGAATLIDSLDTLLILGLQDEFEEAVNAAATLDLKNSEECIVNLFEWNIRYLGGLLAAYDLSGKEVLLEKAIIIGDILYGAFETHNHMPCPHFPWPRPQPHNYEPSSSVALAVLGSLDLEFTRLSQITRDPKYFQATERVTDQIQMWQNRTSLRGMLPILVDATGPSGIRSFPSSTYSLGALSDSAYEYLIKQHLLGNDEKYKAMYKQAIDAIKKHLIFRPMTIDEQDILFTGSVDASKPDAEQVSLRPQVEHLACFQGGMFALGGKAFNIPEDIVLAEKLTNGCVWAYQSTATGIMPEAFRTIPCSNITSCPWDHDLWLKEATQDGLPPGFVEINDRKYLLRPEAIESVFIMYRVTGDPVWQEKGWIMFNAIRKHTRTIYGHSAISDVMATEPSYLDQMESFWIAETLKYCWLLFSDPSYISLDEFVLNTEAHPLQRLL